MTKSRRIRSEFAGFLHALMRGGLPERYSDEAITLVDLVKKASSATLRGKKLNERILDLSVHCHALAGQLDADPRIDGRNLIPVSVREFGTLSFDWRDKAKALKAFAEVVKDIDISPM